jgi:hypothetical protein
MSLVQDPVMNVTLDVISPFQSDWTATSTLLSFSAINPAIGRMNANVTVNDMDGDGAWMSGLHDAGSIYRAAYDGLAGTPGSASFFSAITGASTSNQFDSASAGASIPPWSAIAGPVTDMSEQARFRVSPNDLATTSSSYEVIPTP